MFKYGNADYPSLASAGWNSIVPSMKAVRVVIGDNVDFEGGACRGLWSGEDGTANLVLVDGTELNDFPIFAGMNPFACVRVKTGGTVQNLWAVY